MSLIMLDSVIRANKKHYPQTLLEKCKYEMKKTEMKNIDNDSDPSWSDNETDNEADNDGSNE